MEDTLDKFLCKAGLYEELAISIDDMDNIWRFLKGEVKPDTFCVECRENRVFIGKANRVSRPEEDICILTANNFSGEENPEHGAAIYSSIQQRKIEKYKKFVESNRITILKYQCSKDKNHQLVYVMLLTESYIMKIGQYPSYRDIESPQIKKFQKILGKYFPELSTAIRLFSVNVGIGSFVYLRRIIEKLVHDTFEEAEAVGAMTKQEFEYREAEDGKNYRNGIEEKIKLLKGFLPDMITNQPQIYGIVSKGIHELSEEECLKYFPVMKDGIVMILDDIVAKKEKEKAVEEYKKSLGKIMSDLK